MYTVCFLCVTPQRSVILVNGSTADKAQGYTCLMVANSYRWSVDKVGDGMCVSVKNQPENKN